MGSICVPRTAGDPDLAVIGGGAAGLAAARAGARRGLRTILVSDSPLGGDCTFTGCVPSKTLIEAAARRLPFEVAAARIREVVAGIAASEDATVLRSEGVEVTEGSARFAGRGQICVDGHRLEASRIVIATGSEPAVPQVPGLERVAYLTNETVFDLDRLPGSIGVLGGGPIGCELSQAFARLGAEVHVFEAASRLLPREETEASRVIGEVLAAEGIDLHVGVEVTEVGRAGRSGGVRVECSDGSRVEVDALLVATGRRARTASLDPDAGGIALDGRGFVRTDRFLETSVPGVYAAGDVTGGPGSTHSADEMGRLAVGNAFGRAGRLGRRAFDTAAVPWVTFCDPEVARVGMSEQQAAAAGGRVAFVPFSELDRAIIAGRTEGFVKLVVGPRAGLGNAGGGRVLGATIVAPRAGEMIHEVALAIRTGMFAGRLAQTVHAYPTWSSAIRQAAAQLFMELDGRAARPAEPGRPSRRSP